MKFVSAKTLVDAARNGGYAIPALNANGATYDIARAALEAAQESGAPLILQSYEPNLAYRGAAYFVKMTALLCDELNITVPVALQLDHGHSLESTVKVMQAGFTSVMFDASHELLEKNISKTLEVVRIAKIMGCSVEAEVGYVKGNEPAKERQIGRTAVPERPLITPAKTDIEEAKRFVEFVPVDMLAVSVGTMHGVYKIQDGMDFFLLEKLRREIDVPLVQHGTCGISLENISRLTKSGMSKINFGEPFRFKYIAYFNELTDSMEHQWHAWKIMREIKNRLKSDMIQIIEALGANGKGD